MQPDSRGILRSNNIVLRRENVDNQKSPEIIARVTATNYVKDGALRARGDVYAISNGTEMRLGGEGLSSTGYAFGRGQEFLEPDFKWGVNQDHGRIARYEAENNESRLLFTAEKELLPNIVAIEETQAMLWQALVNRELNPEFAASIRDQVDSSKRPE